MSGRRDGAFYRSQRLIEVAKLIAREFNEKQGNGAAQQFCNYEDIVTLIQFDVGLTEKRAREYVCVVVSAKGWVMKDGYIFPK